MVEVGLSLEEEETEVEAEVEVVGFDSDLTMGGEPGAGEGEGTAEPGDKSVLRSCILGEEERGKGKTNHWDSSPLHF